MTDRKCKQWVQRPTQGQPCLAPLTMGPPMPPGNAHSGGHRRLHPHLRFDSVTSLAPDYSTLQATQSHRGSVSSSLSNLSSVSSMSTPTSQPWYRASQPRIASARAAHLSEKLGHSTGEFLLLMLKSLDQSLTPKSCTPTRSSEAGTFIKWCHS